MACTVQPKSVGKVKHAALLKPPAHLPVEGPREVVQLVRRLVHARVREGDARQIGHANTGIVGPQRKGLLEARVRRIEHRWFTKTFGEGALQSADVPERWIQRNPGQYVKAWPGSTVP